MARPNLGDISLTVPLTNFVPEFGEKIVVVGKREK